MDCKGYRHLLSPAPQYLARDAIIATGLFISEINHVTRGSSSFHGFAGKRRSQGQISRHFYFGCKLILALALEFAAGLWHLEKHFAEEYPTQIEDSNFFIFGHSLCRSMFYSQ